MLNKLRQRYLGKRAIFAIEMAVLMMTSLMSVAFVNQFYRPTAQLLDSLAHVNVLQYIFGLDGWRFLLSIILIFVSSVFALFLSKSYLVPFRHTTYRNFARVATLCFLKVLFLLLLVLFVEHRMFGYEVYPKSLINVLTMDMFVSFFALVSFRILAVELLRGSSHLGVTGSGASKINVMIYGIEEKSRGALFLLKYSAKYRVVGFIVRDEKLKDQEVSNLPIAVVNSARQLLSTRNFYNMEAILFPDIKTINLEKNNLLFLKRCKIESFVVPDVEEIDKSKMLHGIRKVKIEDLLGRNEIKVSEKKINEEFSHKVALVTGGAGSIGRELCMQLSRCGVDKLVVYDNAETPLFYIRHDLKDQFPTMQFEFIVGSVCNKVRLENVFCEYRPTVVFHAAAYKHVPLMEENPMEAVYNNVIGSKNVADMCLKYDVEKMVMISTDKAVNPTNVMGCTKRLAEIYIQSLGEAVASGTHEGHTKFVTTRFGNVLGSNGSVIPLFRSQIEKGGPVTVTDPEITRFFMTIPEACRLVLEAATMTSGNQIFLFDMGESVKIVDLAMNMIKMSGLIPGKDIEIVYTGLRPGEKLYEEVLASSENTIDTDNKNIKIAHVRDYDLSLITEIISKLEFYSQNNEVEQMVRLMKQAVPEFISQNSIFQKYDKH